MRARDVCSKLFILRCDRNYGDGDDPRRRENMHNTKQYVSLYFHVSVAIVRPLRKQVERIIAFLRLMHAMTERMNLRNFNYEDDIRYTVQVHRLIMGLIGVWPNMEKSGKWARLLRGLLRTACCFLLSFNLIPWVLYMFLILDTFKNRLRMIGGFFFYSMVPAMYFTLMLQEDRIKKCIRHLQEDWRNVWDTNDRKIMLDQARAGRFVIICTLLFLFTSGFTHRLIKPILRGTIIIGNVSIRPLVQGNYFIFFDPQQSPAYEIVFSMHLVTGIVIYIVTTSVCGITALFTMHACGQLKMLTVWLENTAIENQWSKCVIAQRLAAIVMHHVRIRK